MVIILVLAIILLYMAEERLYAGYWDKDLQVEIKFDRRQVYEGEKAKLTEVIVNNKMLPLPILEVGFHIDRNLEFSAKENISLSDLLYKKDMFSPLFYQKITRELEIYCGKRGYYEVTKAELRAKSLFLTGNLHLTVEQNTRLFVYPRLMDERIFDVPFRKMMGTLRSQRFLYEDPFEFKGIREYEMFDTMQKINWKASAKSGELMVNTFDSTSTQEVILLLDVEDETVWKYPQLHEVSIRIAATLCVKMIGEGIPVSIVCNGKDLMTKQPIVLPRGNGKQQVTSALECLSRIDLEQKATFFERHLEKIEKRADGRPLYIMISKNQREKLVSRFKNLLEKGVGGYWIIPLHEDMELRLGSTPDMEVFPVEVKR